MSMLNEYINSKIEVPLFRYERLINIETKYDQLFEKLFIENECNEICRTIDLERFNELVEKYNNDDEEEDE